MSFLKSNITPTLLATLCAGPLYAGATLTAANASIGHNLQVFATVALSEPTQTDLTLTLTSGDPARLVIAKTPDAAGTGSLTLKVRAGFRESPEFWLQALGDSGEVAYTATVPGYATSTGKATLSPSGVVIVGPFGEEAPPEFITTPNGWASKILLKTVRLDAGLRGAEQQFVRGGLSVPITFALSDPGVAEITPSTLAISAAEDTAAARFKPVRIGKTVVTLKSPPDFRTPAALNSLAATVRTPGMALANEMTIGENLQLAAAVSLGEPAPAGGVKVRLTSGDPSKMLLSASATEVGKPSIEIAMPPGAVSAQYFLQSLSAAGTVTHTAVAEGFLTRTATLYLAPSGVILSSTDHGPPDRAEIERPESAGSRRNNFVALLSQPNPPLVVYTVFLDPVTKRSADVTVQPLRAGLNLEVDLKNTNPAVGTVAPKAVIKGGDERALFAFKPTGVGETIISVVPPKGFTEPSNSVELRTIVRE